MNGVLLSCYHLDNVQMLNKFEPNWDSILILLASWMNFLMKYAALIVRLQIIKELKKSVKFISR